MTTKKHLLFPAIFITIFSLSFLKVEGQTLPSFNSEQDSILLFSYFKGNGEDGLHLAFSKDGYAYKALNNCKTIHTPEIGPLPSS